MSKTYHKGNFFKHTYCVFQQVTQAHFPFVIAEPHYKSKSGSAYFYSEEGVYRIANHWGRAANCRWRIESLPEAKKERLKIGFARWTDFYPNNYSDRLYVITINEDTVQFQHIQEVGETTNKIVRSATETAKVIRKIKGLLEKRNPYLTDEERTNQIQKLVYL